MDHLPRFTDPQRPVDQERARWTRIYSGEEYHYGDEPGPVARRAVRYHQPWFRGGASSALDAGCGEGQDLAFLAQRGYRVTGIEFTEPGAAKARRLLVQRGLAGEVLHADLRDLPEQKYDLVLAVNAIQFLGSDASAALDRVMQAVAPGGVIGLSLFAREGSLPEVDGTIWFTTLEELMARFAGWQCFETAKLWQWDTQSNRPQGFVTLIARNVPPSSPGVQLR